MAGRRLLTLRTERDNLVDRWMISRGTDKAKLLVKIIDIDEYIDKVTREESKTKEEKVH